MMRYLSSNEIEFIEEMLKGIPEGERIISSLSNCIVTEMNDGGMGGLKFESLKKERSLGRDISKAEFSDEDGVTVIVTLSSDNYGDIYELDLWKVDFSPLKTSLSRKLLSRPDG